MGAMPGNRERKDCQTDFEGVRENDRKTNSGEMCITKKNIIKARKIIQQESSKQERIQALQ